MDSVHKILIISSDTNLKDVLTFCLDGWGYEVFLLNVPKKNSLDDIKRISPEVIVIDVESARKEQLELCRLLKQNFATAFIPIITLINKKQLRSQLLNLKQGVDDYLIKPPDPLDLRIRIEMATRRSQHSIHASSLTGLPGGRILEDVLAEKMEQNVCFSFGYIDIDNFKYFNDVYGYQKGDKVIVQTAYMLSTILSRFGNKDDFIGHIGGDDFVFMTTPYRYKQICYNFIQMFDNIIPFHYAREARDQGFVITRDRSRKIKKIPLMSVSIAVVNRENNLSFKTPVEVNERIAEIKRFLKTIPESKFMADRRDSKLATYKTPQVNKKTNRIKTYKPLGQILLDNNLVSQENLDQALNIHWRKGIMLGQVLKELECISEDKLQRALGTQGINFSYPAFS